MFVAKKYFESNKGVFRKGDEVPADVAEKHFREVEEVKVEKVEKPKKAKKVVEENIEEELLTEVSSSVEVEVVKED